MVKLNKEKCISCGFCESSCPKLFKMNVKAEVKNQPKTQEEKECAKNAAENCPVGAITI